MSCQFHQGEIRGPYRHLTRHRIGPRGRNEVDDEGLSGKMA